ncbi:MAG: LPP20 family lipoprotein [Marinilabiliaceae bacterium]|nr:LPP20 family lipoprotein [Marinilabiliaceae bacterium]
MRLYIYTLICLNLISVNAHAAKKPGWVKERPNDPSYYIGIGRSDKTQSEYKYVTQARNYALREMSSEIKVLVASNSILTQFENNYELKEEFESKVQTSVTQTLEGYEVETWEDKKEYWVMMRLSKDKYELNRRMSLNKDKKLAATYYYSANKSKENGNIFEALNFYVKAIRTISNHLEEDLTYKSIDGDINLGIDLMKGVQDAFNKVDLRPEHDLYSIKFSQQMQYPISVTVTLNNDEDDLKPLPNFPIEFEFTKGDGVLTASSNTNHNGVATCSINRLISKRRLQEVTGKFQLSSLFKNDDECFKLLKLFFPAEIIPKAIIAIEVAKSKAYIISEENVFGEVTKYGLFTNMIKSSLSDNFFTFTTDIEDAEFVVKLVSDFVAGEEKKGNGYSVYIVYGGFNISVINAQNQVEIFSDGVSSVKGMLPGGFEHALKNCREKSYSYFEKFVLSKLEQVDM